MNFITRLRTVAFASVAGLGLAGCSPTAAKNWGFSGGGIHRTGSDGAAVSYDLERLTCDDRTYLVLAAEGCKGSSVGGGLGASSGLLHAMDNRIVVWTCSTEDAKAGKVVIDGREFDLTNGGLFLVFTKELPTRVEQLAVPSDQLQIVSDAEKFQGLAKSNAGIAAFLQSCKAAK